MGALLVTAPAGAGVLLVGLAVGKMVGETALGSFVADALLVPVATLAHGRAGRLAATAVLVPIVAKRLMGNGPPARAGSSVYLYRLLFDRDTRDKPAPQPGRAEPGARLRPEGSAERRQHARAKTDNQRPGRYERQDMEMSN